MRADDPWAGTWERMIGAVNTVQERLTRSTTALKRAGVPHAVIGAHAVAYWVAQRDEGATRNTPNVDILVRRVDLPQATVALHAVGFVRADSGGPRIDFLDGPEGKVHQAVRLWFCGDALKLGAEPLPDVACATAAPRFRVVPLETLVRMKLSVFRTIDNVHIRDLIGVGLIDATWPEKFPEVLAERLREILADPDG